MTRPTSEGGAKDPQKEPPLPKPPNNSSLKQTQALLFSCLRSRTHSARSPSALFLCPRLPLAVSGVVVSSDHNHRGRTHLKKNFYPSKHDDDAIMRGMKQKIILQLREESPKKIRLPLCFHSCAKMSKRSWDHEFSSSVNFGSYLRLSLPFCGIGKPILSTSTFKFRNGVFSSTQDNPRELPHALYSDFIVYRGSIPLNP
ncbi:hypothetical protein CC2G_011461 [Coprinopsis cinerea AmutBmut pab1-1]|nr:hypothetical protein CC2G_011461 [Coprinopsis cinerea AmutBmut pab1-1]